MLEAQAPEMLPPPPMPFENHSIHLSVLKQFLLDEAFEALEDWKKQAIWLRTMIHYSALREEALNTMSKAGQNSPRTPGGGGGGAAQKKDATEQGVRDRESQGASPDVSGGVTTGQE
jgi:hypothetical protein